MHRSPLVTIIDLVDDTAPATTDDRKIIIIIIIIIIIKEAQDFTSTSLYDQTRRSFKRGTKKEKKGNVIYLRNLSGVRGRQKNPSRGSPSGITRLAK